jgi:hypothetical protein
MKKIIGVSEINGYSFDKKLLYCVGTQTTQDITTKSDWWFIEEMTKVLLYNIFLIFVLRHSILAFLQLV